MGMKVETAYSPAARADEQSYSPDGHAQSTVELSPWLAAHKRYEFIGEYAKALTPRLVKPIPVWKRAMDIVFATLALIVLAPVMFVVAVLVKWTSQGPVIFRQERGGRGGRTFTMYKFRTMVQDAEDRKIHLLSLNERSGPAFKLTNDPRVTPVGKVLRKWSLDELPQLFNVLLGDMSLVGPRPLPVQEENGYSHWHRRRLDVNPGITCIWQVTSRANRDFDNWVRLDIQYIQKFSFKQDLRILWLTLPAVLSRRGAV